MNEFELFKRSIRKGIAIGEIRTNKELSDFDLAVTYAIGVIGEERGYPCNIKAEEIFDKIGEFAPELLIKESEE